MNRTVRNQALLFLIATGLTVAGTLSAQGPRIVKLKGLDTLKYDVTRIEAKAGEQLKVELTTVSKMSKQEMAHNFVLIKKNTPVDGFVMEAMMARATDYIPAGKKEFILAQTALAGAGETVEVVFNAPTEPGEYLYICTFPGHYMGGMKGVLVVK